MAAKHLLVHFFLTFFSSHWGNEAADIRSCIDNFVVHTNKIIRTQDSRALGAKYLTEAEVASRDDCLQLCCETVTCDVFVYEHKRRGSCYLFHCGDPQDFKCKFTQHKNYSSGLLMPANELEAQIKLTKHEEELAQLSKKTEGSVTSASVPSTTPLPSTTTKVPTFTKVNATTMTECSRYQFSCRSTKECIAIYNACDGIPQCRDGSDEGPELDCPTLAGGSVASASHNGMKVLPPTAPLGNLLPDVKKNYGSPQQLQFPVYALIDKPESNQQGLDAHQQLVNARMYGREGEGAGDVQPGNGWHSYMVQPRRPQEEGNRMFSYKGGQDTGDSSPPIAYPNDVGRSEYQKSGGGNYYSNLPYNNAPPYNWPQRQRADDPRWMYPGQPPDYYNFEEPQGRGRPTAEHGTSHAEAAPQIQQPKLLEQPVAKHIEKTTLAKIEEEKPIAGKEASSVKKVIAENNTKAIVPTEATHSDGLVMDEDDVVIVEADGINERPRGAMLFLALGMCIAAIMITLLGCKLRVVQRRLRRGKGGFSHDADFLVNGMYL